MTTGCTVLLKRDSRENWNKHDPILKDSEIVVVRDYDEEKVLKKVAFKLGDGVHKYSELPFVPLLECIEKGYIYWGYPVRNTSSGKISIAISEDDWVNY